MQVAGVGEGEDGSRWTRTSLFSGFSDGPVATGAFVDDGAFDFERALFGLDDHRKALPSRGATQGAFGDSDGATAVEVVEVFPADPAGRCVGFGESGSVQCTLPCDRTNIREIGCNRVFYAKMPNWQAQLCCL